MNIVWLVSCYSSGISLPGIFTLTVRRSYTEILSFVYLCFLLASPCSKKGTRPSVLLASEEIFVSEVA